MSNSDRVWTVLSMLEWATDYFEKKKVPNPRLSIEWLIADVLQIKRLDIYLQFDRPFTEEELDRLRPLVKRRGNHEPLQYITGSTEFMSCSIDVTPDVLIPRAETEQLVEIIFEHYPNCESSHSMLDIGTGSGCIPISVKAEYPGWNCAGIDISAKALEVARNNASKNEVDVNFVSGNIFDLDGCMAIQKTDWDIIVSNPPYIKESEKSEMEREVLNYEPALALFHDEPLEVYMRIIRFSHECNAELFLECNDKYAEDILREAGRYFSKTELKKDLDGNNRFVIAKNAISGL